MRHIKYDKKRIKEILKANDHTMIPNSWYTDDNKYDATFNTYDKYGECYEWYVNTERKHAIKQRLSGIVINRKIDASYYFRELFIEEESA